MGCFGFSQLLHPCRRKLKESAASVQYAVLCGFFDSAPMLLRMVRWINTKEDHAGSLLPATMAKGMCLLGLNPGPVGVGSNYAYKHAMCSVFVAIGG